MTNKTVAFRRISKRIASTHIALVVAILGGILVTVAAVLAYHTSLLHARTLVVGAFVASVFSFVAIGTLLKSVLPTTRAAQGLGSIPIIVMTMLAGADSPNVLDDRG